MLNFFRVIFRVACIADVSLMNKKYFSVWGIFLRMVIVFVVEPGKSLNYFIFE